MYAWHERVSHVPAVVALALVLLRGMAVAGRLGTSLLDVLNNRSIIYRASITNPFHQHHRGNGVPTLRLLLTAAVLLAALLLLAAFLAGAASLAAAAAGATANAREPRSHVISCMCISTADIHTSVLHFWSETTTKTVDENGPFNKPFLTSSSSSETWSAPNGLGMVHWE